MPFAPISSLLVQVIGFINVILVPLVMALAFLMFLWGVFKYFIAGGASEEARTEGQKFVMWSVIAFAIIFSIWGIVGLLVNSFGFGSPYRPPLPQFTPPSGFNR